MQRRWSWTDLKRMMNDFESKDGKFVRKENAEGILFTSGYTAGWPGLQRDDIFL